MKGFLKDHMDTLAIIGTVVTMLAWNVSQNTTLSVRIDQTNQRLDQTNQRLDQVYGTIIEMLKERKHESHS